MLIYTKSIGCKYTHFFWNRSLPQPKNILDSNTSHIKRFEHDTHFVTLFKTRQCWK